MAKELDPVRAEAYKRNPDWATVAERIAAQPGCEDFPVATVDSILARPGELIVIMCHDDAAFFIVGAMIAARERPFSVVAANNASEPITALQIYPERKGESYPSYVYASLETGFSMASNITGTLSNWMGPGVRGELDILTADEPHSELAIGTDQVNGLFEKLAHAERFENMKDRLVGMLFQTARLAVDFGAPTPTAPTALQPELSQAKSYYETAKVRAQAIRDLRHCAAQLEGLVEGVPRPAIHFERPLTMPTPKDLEAIQRAIPGYPSEHDIKYALQYYDKALGVLSSLG